MVEELDDPFVVPIGRRRMRAHRGEGFHWFGIEESFAIGLRFAASGEVYIKFLIGNDLVWGDQENAGASLDDGAFVSFFGANWNALWLENFPDNVPVESTREWWPAVSQRRPGFSKVRQSLQFKWDHFRARHCLSGLLLAKQGDALRPEIWFVNVHASMLVDVPELALRHMVPIGAVMNCVERACNMIVARMSAKQVSEREGSAIKIWRSRNEKKSAVELVQFFTGIDDDQLLNRMSQDISATSARDVFAHGSEILAAARMRPTGLRPEDINVIFDRILETPKVKTVLLDRLSQEALEELDYVLRSSEPPFVQGAEIAAWLRARLNYNKENVLDPASLLKEWNVFVREFAVFNGGLDAIAVWGPKHGPAVLINRNGRHSRGFAGKRATLAHEICHLLIDRKMTLPLADVVGGSVPEPIEQRARAFAAELLLPQRAMYDLFLQTDQSLHETNDLLSYAMKHYRVSRPIAAHQLQNSIYRFHSDSLNVRHVLAYLDTITSEHWIFPHYLKVPL